MALPSRRDVNAVVCSLCRSPPASFDSEDGLILEKDKVKRQCSVIFLVKTLLRIPLPQCEELLRVYGDPEEWITLCSPCTALLNQGLDMNEQINTFRRKIVELEEQVLSVPLKIRQEKNVGWEPWVCSAAEEIRRIIFHRNNGFIETSQFGNNGNLNDEDKEASTTDWMNEQINQLRKKIEDLGEALPLPLKNTTTKSGKADDRSGVGHKSDQRKPRPGKGPKKTQNKSKCALCCNSCNYGQARTEEDKLQRQCSVIFLVRNLLRIPRPQCEELLMTYGDPEKWMTLCSSCTALLNQGLDMNEQINTFRRKIVELGDKLELPLKIKPEYGDEWEAEDATSPATKEIRRIVFRRGDSQCAKSIHEDGIRHNQTGTPMQAKDANQEKLIDPSELLPASCSFNDQKRERKKIRDKRNTSETIVEATRRSDSESDDDDDDDPDFDHPEFQNSPEFSPNESENEHDKNKNDDDDDGEDQCTETDTEEDLESSKKQELVCSPTPKVKHGRDILSKVMDYMPRNEGSTSSRNAKLKCIVSSFYAVAFRELEGLDVWRCIQPGCCFKILNSTKTKEEMRRHLKSSHDIIPEEEPEETLFTATPRKIEDIVSAMELEERSASTHHHEKEESVSVSSLSCRLCDHLEFKRTNMIWHLNKMHNIHVPFSNEDKVLKHAEKLVESVLVLKTISALPEQMIYAPCPFCDFAAIGRLRLANHIEERHSLHCHVFPKEWGNTPSDTSGSQSTPLLIENGGIITQSNDERKNLPFQLPISSVVMYGCKETGCDAKFPYYRDLLDHINKEHKSGHRCEIDQCRKVFRSLADLENYERVKHCDQTLCPGCGTSHNTLGAFQSHLQGGDSNPECQEKAIPCSFCKRKLENQTTLDIHIKIKHLMEDQFPFQCPHCQKGFKMKNTLYYYHVRSHVEDTSAVCDKCGQRFQNSLYLRQHLKYVHANGKTGRVRDGRERIQPIPTRKKKDKDSFKYVCNVCGRSFKFQELLTSHMWSHDHDPNQRLQPRMKNGPRRATCTTSTEAYGELGNDTQGFHNNSFVCTEAGCEAKFPTYVELKEHRNIEHSSLGYLCDLCREVLSTLKTLENHTRKMHIDRAFHKCPGCGEANRDSTVFQLHLRKREGKPECSDKSLQCPDCNWKLENQTTLDIHMKIIHFTEYPCAFHCPHCRKGFKVRNSFYHIHVRSHTEDVSVVCDQCNRRISDPIRLLEHFRTAHGMDSHEIRRRKI